MQPEIDILGLPLKTFGLMFALAFLAAGAVLARRLEELGRPTDWAYEIIFAGLAGGIVGSRVYYLVQNYDDVKDDLLGNVFSGSGLVWYGGAIGGAIAVVLWAWRRGLLGVALLDLCAVPLALGYAIGRVGCQVSGRRRLRQAVGRPMGDGLSRRDGADDGRGPPDPDLRDPGDGAARLRPVAAARPLQAGCPVRASTWLARGSSGCSWSSCVAIPRRSPD